MEAEDLEIEYVPLESLKPYAGNAKLHPAAQVEGIAKSIERFGFKDPIAIWHGEVVAGHGRLLAVKMLNGRGAGIESVPVVRLDGMTDEERRAYALAHNKTAIDTGFDDPLLRAELDALADFDMDDWFPDLGAEPLAQTLAQGRELDADDFGDDKFKCQCPKCGFRFNPDA